MKWMGLLVVVAVVAGCMEPTWPSGVPAESRWGNDAAHWATAGGARTDDCGWGMVHQSVAVQPTDARPSPVPLECY
jgi:hypothetical protein